jgi:hypothetical protein
VLKSHAQGTLSLSLLLQSTLLNTLVIAKERETHTKVQICLKRKKIILICRGCDSMHNVYEKLDEKTKNRNDKKIRRGGYKINKNRSFKLDQNNNQLEKAQWKTQFGLQCKKMGETETEEREKRKKKKKRNT